jgi:hypothetical protein
MPGGEQQEMPEPVTGAVVLAKAMGSTGSDAENATGKLLERLLGPSVDVVGEALARSAAYRTRNFGRIAQKADVKSRGSRDGIVNTRVAFVMLEDGSLCDDELMAEYLGGVLAAARTPNGKDDRAVSWIKIIAGLSALQARAHYLFYREWAARLHDRADLNLGTSAGTKKATLDVDFFEFGLLLNTDDSITLNEAISHAVPGLQAANLLGDEYSFGNRSTVALDSPFEYVVRVMPSARGCELYGWAQGLSGLVAPEFVSKAEAFDTEPAIPRLEKVALVGLPTIQENSGIGSANA